MSRHPQYLYKTVLNDQLLAAETIFASLVNAFFQRMAWKRKKNASLNPFATLLSIRKPIQTTKGGRIPMSDANF